MYTIDQRLGVHYIGQLFEKPINPLPSFNVFPLILLIWWLIYVPTYTFSVAALLWQLPLFAFLSKVLSLPPLPLSLPSFFLSSLPSSLPFDATLALAVSYC